MIALKSDNCFQNFAMSNKFPEFDHFDSGLYIKLRSYLCSGFDVGFVVTPHKQNFPSLQRALSKILYTDYQLCI